MSWFVVCCLDWTYLSGEAEAWGQSGEVLCIERRRPGVPAVYSWRQVVAAHSITSSARVVVLCVGRCRRVLTHRTAPCLLCLSSGPVRTAGMMVCPVWLSP